MPFTFSHPALIIPLKYLPARYVSMTGLVVGSVAPDFEKFIKLSGGNIYSHTLSGILWFNLPLALALAFIFHLVVRDILIDNLPVFFRERLVKYKRFKWSRHFKRNTGVVAGSIIFATFLHVLVDSFTHEGAPYLYLFPFLLKPVAFGKIVLIRAVILNLFISIAGLIYIVYAFIRLPTTPVKPKKYSSYLKFWLVVIGITLAIVAIKFMIGGVIVSKWQLIYIGIGAGMMSIFVSTMLWKKIKVS